MANATWLPVMPQDVVVDGYQGGYFDNVYETTPTAGVGSSNPIYSAVPEMIVCSTPSIDRGQLTAFETWYRDTLGWGCLPFDWVHPETKVPCTIKFYKGQGGRHYTRQPKPGGKWSLTMSLVVLPGVAG